MRFANGSALLRHSLIRAGFLQAWFEVIPQALRSSVFTSLEEALNAVAAKRGELSLRIPVLYVEAVAPG